MKYLNKIGVNAKKAFVDLIKVDSSKIKKVLANYNKSLLSNKKQIIKSRKI